MRTTKPTAYAANTSVSAARSRCAIEELLRKHGATDFGSGWVQGMTLHAFVMFDLHSRRVKFLLPMPDPKDFAVTGVKRKRHLAPKQREAACEKEERRRWRALCLVIKAKLEAVASGITHFEEEFLAHIVLPDGRTAGQFMLPQIAEAYTSRRMPPMLGNSV